MDSALGLCLLWRTLLVKKIEDEGDFLKRGVAGSEEDDGDRDWVRVSFLGSKGVSCLPFPLPNSVFGGN